ncbi:MAG: hypothetical protein Greene041662_689 [Candidatus Peregrinibacteria bacterium Greene0416_62]|nr:MAG: hypothetical protein Greene041662_689 [Candidatus Peregrinibacteria bacterium Greene0416_62]TSC97981.1 MAG: hypothetical protein Greene101449_1049 [Candidatus Peregrinibacteria bacterium Greene1014_49]
MRKSVLLLVAGIVSLTACSGSSATVSTCVKDYWDGEVGTCLPENWIVVDSETLLQRGVPSETLVAFQAEQAVSGQFPTVAVTREVMSQEVSAQDYSAASIRSVSVLPGYEQVDSRDIRIDEEKISLHIFTAQPDTGEPRRRYYQVSFPKGKKGYTMTATTPVAIEDAVEGQILAILEGFTLTEPVKEK